jgi:2-keto-4-pentenoate hydratase
MRVGATCGLSRSDLLALDDLEVVLHCDDGLNEVGAARVVLGGPLRALAAAMSAAGAFDLDDGDIVSTGTLTGRSHPVGKGQSWTLEANEPGLLASCAVTVC